jgi:hypothetical protein
VRGFDSSTYTLTPTLSLRDCVAILISDQIVISSEARNLLILNAYEFKIPRLKPRNDIITPSPRERELSDSLPRGISISVCKDVRE